MSDADKEKMWREFYSPEHFSCWKLLPKVQSNWNIAHRHSACILPMQTILQLPGAQQIQGIFKVRVHQQDIDTHIQPHRHITNYIDNEYLDISTEFANPG